MPKVIPMPARVEKVVAERDQLSHGRLIHVVSVFPADGACSPEDKLKTLIDMDLKNSHTVAERGWTNRPVRGNITQTLDGLTGEKEAFMSQSNKGKSPPCTAA